MDPADVNQTFCKKNFDCRKSYVDEEDIVKKMSITSYSIIFLLGTIGNGLVIWVAVSRIKKTIFAVWLRNLAVADFLCCASLPLRIAEWVKHFSHFLSAFCQLSNTLFNLNMIASVLLLVAMSIEQWVSIMFPLWAEVHVTRNRVRITIAIIWVLSFLLAFLAFYFFPNNFGNLTERCYMVVSHANDIILSTNQTIQLIKLVILFLIPFLIILISYITNYFILREIGRPRRSHRIITAVKVYFFICWCPYYVWPLTYKYGGKTIQLYAVHVSIINLACFNSCINPIIYVVMGQDFKHGFFRSIPFRIERALSGQPNDLYREGEDVQHGPITDA